MTYFSQPNDASGQTLNLLRDRPLTQQVCVSGECFTNSSTYKGPGYAKDTETHSGVTTSFGYENDGNLSLVTNAVNKTLGLSEYDVGGGTPRRLDFGGGTIVYTRTTTWEGWILTQTDGRNNTTQYDYDAIGRVKKITPPGPNEATTYTYDNTNLTNVVVTRGTGYTRTTTFDGFRRQTETLDSLGVTTTVKYDELGQVWFRSAPYDSSTGEVGEKSDRDMLGRVTTLSKGCRGAGSPTLACSPTKYLSTVTFAYQPGNCVETTEQRTPDTLVTKRCYSSLGNLEELRLSTVTDAAGKPWAYTYTASGVLRTVTTPLSAGNRTYEIDPRQYLTGERSAELGLIAADTVSIRYAPNDIGQVTSRKDARGVTWIYDYNDGLSRLKGITYGPGSPDNVTQSYQPFSNNLATLSSANGGTFNFTTYDELDRLRSQQWTFGGVTYTTTLDYDPTGCLYSIKYPTESVVTQTCDPAGRVTSIMLNGATLVSNIHYHPSGQPKDKTFGNNKATTIVYDDRARMESLTSAGVIGLSYGYDGTDNVISLDNLAVPGSSRTMPGGYDKLNRLATVQAPNLWGTADYQYNDLGNRKLKTVGTNTTSYTYDPQTNRLATATGSDTFEPMTFSWDLAARLAASSDGATYYYDGRGRRVQKSGPNQTTVYHYDTSGRLISETLPNGQKLRDYIYLGNRLIALDGCISASPPACSERQWYHTDALGSVLARTDSSGNVVARFEYEPWGELWTAQPVPGTRQYNGRVLDPGTAFYDYGARMYYQSVGRFISVDTARADTSNPQSSNVYAYVLDNPYKYTDPTGHVPFLLVTGAVGVIVGGGTGAIVSYWRTGEVTWEAVATGALVGGTIGLTGGAALASATTGSATAGFGSVLTGLLTSGGAATAAGGGALAAGGAARPEGTATIYAYGTEHLNIAVSQGTEVLQTGLTRVNGMAIVGEETAAGATRSLEVALPNAKSALDFAINAIGPRGPYNLATNSCVTYCGEVLRAGGVSDVPTTTRTIMHWLNDLAGQ
jgi:RHS repeat-associated protein